MPPILLIDDDERVLQTWSKALSKLDLGPVETCTDGEQGWARLRDGRHRLCLLDLRMPKKDGLAVLAAAKRSELRTPIVMVSGYADREETAEAFRLGAADVWIKPILPSELAHKVRGLLPEERPAPQVAAERVDAWLAEHATMRGLRLVDLCAGLGISASYATKLLRECLGTTFRRRVRFHRVERAKVLLRDPAVKIEVVAERSGFGSYRRLDEALGALMEMSPREYRQITARFRSK